MDDFIILFLIFVALILFFLTRKLPPETYAHWNRLIDDMQFSTKEFYDTIEEVLKSHDIKDISYSRIMLSESGLLSSKREYLRIKRGNITHDIGAFPFDGGFFVTSWQYKEMTVFEDLVRKTPVVGPVMHQFFFPVTYYTIDTASMYLHYVHHSLLMVIDTITQTQGIRGLTEVERTPQLRDIFKR